jgi:hypothetical protein
MVNKLAVRVDIDIGGYRAGRGLDRGLTTANRQK